MAHPEKTAAFPDSSEPPKGRPVGGTENSWCRAVPGGTGITVLALLLSKPTDISLLQNALHKLQNSHPILKSKLHFDPVTNSYSYVTLPAPFLQVQSFDRPSTAQILSGGSGKSSSCAVSHFHLILEHELNQNIWQFRDPPSVVSIADQDLVHASVYALSEDKWVVTLRLHTSACDRTAAVALLRELLTVVAGEEGTRKDLDVKTEVSLGIEECIPGGKASKPFWARGVDLLGYSLNSFRLANLGFMDTESTRGSQMVRLKISSQETDKILSGCKRRGIKLCGLIGAAGLMAARASKGLPPEQWEKYAVVTLIDCRSILHPPLTPHHLGFYHSAILNTHDINGGEELWELANRTYSSFTNAKNNNKHFSDMADINLLMCKAIENPGLTPSSSLRTSLISVFEEPVFDHSGKLHEEVGLEDYSGCASVHGVGPSIGVFDTIRNGELDCACVYPSPLHSREQMQDLVEEMKRILVDGSSQELQVHEG